MENFLNKKIIVKQVKGGSKFNDRQKGSLIGLGLRGVGTESALNCTKEVAGMIKKVNHAITISLA